VVPDIHQNIAKQSHAATTAYYRNMDFFEDAATDISYQVPLTA
jgi:hypothetical protein